MNILNLHVKKATLSQKHSLVKESPHVFYPSFLLVLCILDIIRLAREQDIPVTDIPHVSALCHITLHIAPPIALIYVNNSFFFPVPFLYYIYAIAGVRTDGHLNKKQNIFSSGTKKDLPSGGLFLRCPHCILHSFAYSDCPMQ